MDLGLRDRVYVVSGGSRALGRAAAEALVADGARVIIGSRDEASVRRTAAELGGYGVVADTADPDAARRMVDAARERYGRLDGALISVGGPALGAAMDISDDQWRQAFDTVFVGTVRLARAVAAELKDGGSIAFVLSSSARSPIPGLAISNGLRPGLAMVAKTLADELGPRGIRVNGLMPGRISTDRVREMDEQRGTDTSQGIPLRRYGAPEEFGRVAAFLLSPAASYLSGIMVPVDGGALRTI
jgi:3-oxoacyl-[acyl-carrier protein] reductase